MASIIRPSLLRQARSAAPIRNLTSTQSTIRHPHSPILNKRASLFRLSPIQSRGFHASSIRPLLKALPQNVKGGVNDAAPVPETSSAHGSFHWTFERLVAAGMIPLTIAPFAAGSLHPVMDAILCSTLIIHTHIGFQAAITDYLPKQRVPKIRKLFEWGLRLGTLLVALGFYEFETNDVGLTEGIKRIWKA